MELRMEIDQALLDDYRAASYSVDADGERIELRVDTHCPALDAVLRRRGADRWAMMTAYNPRSDVRPDAENEEAQRALEAALAGFTLLPSVGGSTDGRWSEPGVLAIGIDEALARDLMRRFAQNAYLVGRAGGVVELRVTEDG
jgi:hypothetical protein